MSRAAGAGHARRAAGDAAVRDELVIFSPVRARSGPGGGLIVTQKYIEGADEYARSWPGPVTSLFERADTASSDFDHVEVLPGTTRAGLELRPDDDAALAARLSRAAIVLAGPSAREKSIAELCRRLGIPVVLVCEYSPRTEMQIVDASTPNPLRRWRRKLWTWRAHRRRMQAMRIATSIQCSGTPTYDRYRAIKPDALLFFDNRVRAADVIGEEALDARLRALAESRPLRLVFGGRLIEMKGVMALPEVAAALRALGVDFTLEIYGRGTLEHRLRARVQALGLSDQVTLHDALDFRSGWIPLLKSRADLFVCCHPQGDPSSTYPEVMSCGVPIAGYDNEAFAGILARSGAGWATPIGDPAALARCIARLAMQPDEIRDASRKARAFSLEHTFSETFRRRVAHLRERSLLPESA